MPDSPPPKPPPPHGYANLAAISLASTIPEFWTRQPRLWFLRIEAVMAPQRLGNASRYDLVVSKLNADVISQITDILTNPPATGKYEAIKAKLLQIYEKN